MRLLQAKKSHNGLETPHGWHAYPEIKPTTNPQQFTPSMSALPPWSSENKSIKVEGGRDMALTQLVCLPRA